MSLLSVVQSVAPLLGINRPAVALNSTDITIQQLVAIVQEEGDELARRHDWGALKTPLPGTFTGDGTTLSFALPANFHRLPNGPIFWRRDRSYMPLSGPMSDMEWRALQAVNFTSVVNYAWRVRRPNVEVVPALPAGEIVDYEYLSQAWIVTAANDRVTALTNDTDTFLVPEVLLKLGTRWRWKKSKGLEYAEDFRTYEMMLGIEADADKGRAIFATGSGDNDLPTPQVPDQVIV
jgi:hypothetical protein